MMGKRFQVQKFVVKLKIKEEGALGLLASSHETVHSAISIVNNHFLA